MIVPHWLYVAWCVLVVLMLISFFVFFSGVILCITMYFSFFFFLSFLCCYSVVVFIFLVASFDGLRPLLVTCHCSLCSLANKLRSFVRYEKSSMIRHVC